GEAIGLPRLGGGVRHVHHETLCIGDRPRDLRYEKACADGREEAAGAEGDEVGRRDGLDASVGCTNVVVFQVDALDRGLAGRADVDLFLDHTPVGKLRAEMRVVEGYRKDAATDAEEPRGLFDRAEERSLLLCERGQEQIAERHPVQLLT